MKTYPVGSTIRTDRGMVGVVTYYIAPTSADEHGELEIEVTASPSGKTCIEVGDLEHIAIYHPASKWYEADEPQVVAGK